MENKNEARDPRLWRIAQKRASFRSHLATYLIINVFLWCIWFFTAREAGESAVPWPVWPTLGWGIGLAFHYAAAYISSDNIAEKEYEKLKNKNI